MKKSYIIIGLIVLLIAFGIGYYFYNQKLKTSSSNEENSSYNSTKVSSTDNETNSTQNTTENSTENTATNQANETENQVDDSNNKQDDTNSTTNEASSQSQNMQTTETQIAEFSTKIYTQDSERQNNILITCSSLNDTTVDIGETFSFCQTVGKATSSKGYEKADVYQDGEVVQALGGGNCQVSSTLYNAVLKVDGLSVTERHEHSNSVPYVSKGKDAAVAYGSYDFKFVNNTGTKIKISSSNDKQFVYIKIFKIA